LLVGRELQAGNDEFGADKQGHQAADEKKTKHGDDLHDVGRLVIGGHQHVQQFAAFAQPRRYRPRRAEACHGWRFDGDVDTSGRGRTIREPARLTPQALGQSTEPTIIRLPVDTVPLDFLIAHARWLTKRQTQSHLIGKRLHEPELH
jgi:hypothetical protein